MWDLTINLAASAIAGLAVWLAQYALRRRRLERKRKFFGLAKDAQCTFYVARHASSPRVNSVHRLDMAALMELSMIAGDCGSRPEIASFDDPPSGIGAATEFTVGGPGTNPRTSQHLRWLLPGVTAGEDGKELLTIHVGDRAFSREAGVYEYVLLARVFPPNGGLPVFILYGQTAPTNQAAARYLAERYSRLARDHADRAFCLMLRIVDPPAYGNSVIEFVADVTAEALRPPAASAVAAAPAAASVSAAGSAATVIPQRDAPEQGKMKK
ncbi:hypothetical protein F4553_001587 [Allocatelliglobosispora scoriae]|uniref:Secreted protein n=1 Tax=Allocatelliglobosispora scoriae TaxID=643052 RepID=A0A841BLG7_9ACTN|nr:hypothetical protein [Allocatelliglobosispora scoriae]MBB5868208.1 hypothetical protein [Allocatelliglobosispora scoriae]